MVTSLAQSHEALFNDVSLSLRESTSTGQAVDGVQHGVNHNSSVVTPGKEWGTFGDKRQNGRAQVAVQSKSHLRGAESSLSCWTEIVKWLKSLSTTLPKEQVQL